MGYEKSADIVLEMSLLRHEEMKLPWFFVDALPFDLMWTDDRHWFS